MEIIAFFNSITLLSVVKLLMVLLLIVYTIFAYLMMIQAKAMTKAIVMRDDYVIRILAVAHLVMAGLVLFIALTIL